MLEIKPLPHPPRENAKLDSTPIHFTTRIFEHASGLLIRAGTVDKTAEALAKGNTTALIAQSGTQLEALMRAEDPHNSGTIPVGKFSACLRALGTDTSDGGSGGTGGGGILTRADRKVLYRRWAVLGQVRDPEGRVKTISVKCLIPRRTIEIEPRRDRQRRVVGLGVPFRGHSS